MRPGGGRLDVVCVADMCVDLVLRGNVRPRFGQVEQIVGNYFLELGGSANIFAAQFVKLGGRAGVVGWVGDDVFGSFMLTRLEALGIDISRVRRHAHLRTGLGVALAEPDDRAILTYPGTIDAVTTAQLDEDLLSACRHWHVASYFLLSRLRDIWPEWLERLKAANLTTSLDTNWDPEARWAGVLELLRWVDVFLPNEAEARAICGESSVRKAGERLARHGPLVVIKCGANGAMAFREDQCWSVPALHEGGRAAPIVDTIGAGDNFDAGFLRGWLLRWGVPECLDLAQRCAVSSLGGAGGIQGQLVEEPAQGHND